MTLSSPAQILAVYDTKNILIVLSESIDCPHHNPDNLLVNPKASISVMHHALIRTHHITSRNKVSTLKAAAKKHSCSALLRSGGTPGIMYVRGDEENMMEWVGIVHVCPEISPSFGRYVSTRKLSMHPTLHPV